MTYLFPENQPSPLKRIREQKEIAEMDILNILCKLQEETGLCPMELQFNVHECTSLDSKRRTHRPHGVYIQFEQI
jgi:hypothetical protein